MCMTDSTRSRCEQFFFLQWKFTTVNMRVRPRCTVVDRWDVITAFQDRQDMQERREGFR